MVGEIVGVFVVYVGWYGGCIRVVFGSGVVEWGVVVIVDII